MSLATRGSNKGRLLFGAKTWLSKRARFSHGFCFSRTKSTHTHTTLSFPMEIIDSNRRVRKALQAVFARQGLEEESEEDDERCAQIRSIFVDVVVWWQRHGFNLTNTTMLKEFMLFVESRNAACHDEFERAFLDFVSAKLSSRIDPDDFVEALCEDSRGQIIEIMTRCGEAPLALVFYEFFCQLRHQGEAAFLYDRAPSL